jgi:hypothetical protein
MLSMNGNLKPFCLCSPFVLSCVEGRTSNFSVRISYRLFKKNARRLGRCLRLAICNSEAHAVTFGFNPDSAVKPAMQEARLNPGAAKACPAGLQTANLKWQI